VHELVDAGWREERCDPAVAGKLVEEAVRVSLQPATLRSALLGEAGLASYLVRHDDIVV